MNVNHYNWNTWPLGILSHAYLKVEYLSSYYPSLNDVYCVSIVTKLHTVGSSEKNLEHYSVSVNKTILQYQLPENGGFVIYGMWNFEIYVGQVIYARTIMVIFMWVDNTTEIITNEYELIYLIIIYAMCTEI
jgi:hypothetical protein